MKFPRYYYVGLAGAVFLAPLTPKAVAWLQDGDYGEFAGYAALLVVWLLLWFASYRKHVRWWKSLGSSDNTKHD